MYVGPARDGRGLVRFAADGTGGQSVGFAFAADTRGDRSRNASAAPFPSIGATGCVADTPACGPDDEDGGGLFAGGMLGGEAWLLAGGGRSGGDLDRLYATRDTAGTLQLAYLDLHDLLGGQTRAVSAIHSLAGRVHVGFTDTGGNRPYLLSLLAAPAAPGLDVVTGVHAIDLGGDDLPGLATANQAMIDAMGDLGGLLYVANAGGWVRSTVSQPRPYAGNPGDWSVTTPSAAAYGQLATRTTSKTMDLEPADRAVPAMAAFRGRLFAGRNTVAGPQLWACTPATTGDPTGCDRDDWTLVAGNLVGDLRLTQLGDPGALTISLVAATSTHLYVGFDGVTDGLRVFRTTSATPALADFEGPLGGAGFGNSGRRRIFSAAVVADALWLVVGQAAGVGTSSVWRLGE